MPFYIDNVEVCMPGEFRYYEEEALSAQELKEDFEAKHEYEELLGKPAEIPVSEQYIAYFALKGAMNGNPAVKTRVTLCNIYPTTGFRKGYHTVRFKLVGDDNQAVGNVINETMAPGNIIKPNLPLFVMRSNGKRGRELMNGFLREPDSSNECIY